MKKTSLGIAILLLPATGQMAAHWWSSNSTSSPQDVPQAQPDNETKRSIFESPCEKALKEAYKFAKGNTYRARKKSNNETRHQYPCPLCGKLDECDEHYHQKYEPTLHSKVEECSRECKKPTQEIYNQLIERSMDEKDFKTNETLVQAKKDDQGPVQWVKDNPKASLASVVLAGVAGVVGYNLKK